MENKPDMCLGANPVNGKLRNRLAGEEMTMTEQERERMFQEVVSIAHDATGGNCAFEPEYGMYYLNLIRIAMGLRPVVSDDLKADIAHMSSLL